MSDILERLRPARENRDQLPDGVDIWDACTQLYDEVERLRLLLNTPETDDFDVGVPLEAAHQKYRWGADHDEQKDAYDWFWLIGYLSQKAAASAQAGEVEKARHHVITTAAALRNWFGRLPAPAREPSDGH